jgi:hypothetical protein
MFPWAWSLSDWWRAIQVFVASALLGGLVWWASPIVTGKAEPWDANSPFLAASLFLIGLVTAMFHPRAFWVAAAGVCVGQMLYLWRFHEHAGDIPWILSWIASAVYSTAALLGAAIGAVTMAVMHIVTRLARLVPAVRKRLAGLRPETRDETVAMQSADQGRGLS